MPRIQFIIPIIIILFVLLLKMMIEDYKQAKIIQLTHCAQKTPSITIPSPSNNQHIILLGDSRIQEWGTPSFGTNATVINLGVGGETTYQTLCRLDNILALEADLIILQIGINDLVAISLLPPDLQLQTQQKSFDNLKKILIQLSKEEKNILLLTLVPPIKPSFLKKFVWGEGIAQSTEVFNQNILNISTKKIHVLNMKDIFFDVPGNRWKKEYSKNALHWNSQAYTTLTQVIRTQLTAHSSPLE